MGHYRIEDTLGHGGYGVVYRATRTDGSFRVALKVLHARLCDDPRVVKRFYREAQMTQALSHKNIVETLDTGETKQGAPFIALEFLEGAPLNRWAKGSAVPWPTVALIGEQVLAALWAAHRVGIAHRDIKPHNIFLVGGRADHVKVLDFGIAKAFEQEDIDATKLTDTGALMGTARYMAPEQVRAGDVDHRADLYAVGLTLAGLVMGRHVLQATRQVDALFEHVAPHAHELSPELTASPIGPILAKAIRKSRDERYQDAGSMLRDLAQARAAAPQDAAAWNPSMARVVAPTVAPTEAPTRVPSQAQPAAATLPMTSVPGHAAFTPIETPAARPRRRAWLPVIAMAAAAVAGVVAWQVATSADGGAPSASTTKKTKKKAANKPRSKKANGKKTKEAALAALTVPALTMRLEALGWLPRDDQPKATDDEEGTRTEIAVAREGDTGVVTLHRCKSEDVAAKRADTTSMIKGMRVAHEGEVVLTVYLHQGERESQRLLEQLLSAR